MRPDDSRLYRGEGGNKNITYWPPVVLYTGNFKPNHATDLLHEMVYFKKNQQDFTAVLVKLQNAYGRKQHNSSHLRLSVKIKKLQSIHCCGVGEFTKKGTDTWLMKTKQRRIR